MPGGLTLLQSLNADIPTPPTGKVTVFFSTNLGQPAYKDDLGVVRTLVGTAGATGASGPAGPAGFADDGLDGDPFPAQQGPQGNPGTTGVQGPIGPVFLLEDGIDGDNGFPGVNGVDSAGGLFVALVNVTDAEFRSLNTVPKQIVAAPGADMVLSAVAFAIAYDITGVFSASNTLGIRYATGSLTTGITALTTSANGTGKKYGHSIAATALAGTINYDNNALEVFTSAAVTGGTTRGGFNCYVWYKTIVLP